MEDMLEVIFVFIAIGASIISSISKAKKRKADAAARRVRFPAQPAAAQKKAPHPYVPAAQPVIPAMSVGDVPGQVIMPTVHTHLQPDCETHDAPGSLDFTSTEGKDPCHEAQLTHERTDVRSAPEAPGLTLEWSGENMVKAFIMQEVLTRPCQRHAR